MFNFGLITGFTEQGISQISKGMQDFCSKLKTHKKILQRIEP
jgi:hypothetical protein